MIITSNSKKVL